MKSSIQKQQFESIFRLLDGVSPIDGDCGQLCGAACCTCQSPDMGMYLLPGEDKIYTREEEWLSWEHCRAEDYEFPDSWHGKVYFLKCKNAPFCDRKKRPLQCRTFPLAPHLDEDGALFLIYHSSPLPYECPLITQQIPLNRDFIEATYSAWLQLIQDPLIYDLVEMDSDFRMEDDEPINIVYPVI